MGLTACDKPCDECLFSKNRVVSARRAHEIIEGCKASDNHFVCHKSTIANGPNSSDGVVCAGFMELHEETGVGNLLRILGRLGGVPRVSVEALSARAKAVADGSA